MATLLSATTVNAVRSAGETRFYEPIKSGEFFLPQGYIDEANEYMSARALTACGERFSAIGASAEASAFSTSLGVIGGGFASGQSLLIAIGAWHAKNLGSTEGTMSAWSSLSSIDDVKTIVTNDEQVRVNGEGGEDDWISCKVDELVKDSCYSFGVGTNNYIRDWIKEDLQLNNVLPKDMQHVFLRSNISAGGGAEISSETTTALFENNPEMFAIHPVYTGALIANKFDNDMCKPSHDPAMFAIYAHARKHCGKVDTGVPGDSYTVVKEGDKFVKKSGLMIYNTDNNMQISSKVTVFPGVNNFLAPGTTDSDMTCQEIDDNYKKYVDSYVDAANQYCQDDPEACSKIAEGEQLDPEDADDPGDDAVDQCSASLKGFGWILCPIVGLMSDFTDQFYNWVNGMLNWTLLADDSQGVIGSTWQSFLTIANIVFAIAFLVMIYSMATSTGLSNYDIKKMLPRLIVVAIAVNLSFYICAALVDLSNIAGVGAKGLMSDIGGVGKYVSVGDEPWSGITGAVAIIAIVLTAIFFLGSAIFGLIMILIMLIFRQMMLVALVVISPIAIACSMLPNTTNWFRKWRDLFVRLLLVYPMFGLVWGSAQGLASLLAATQGSDGIPAFLFSLVGLIVPALAIIPIFKATGGIMAFAAGAVAGNAAMQGIRRRGNSATRNVGKTAVDAAGRATVGRAGTGLGGMVRNFGARHGLAWVEQAGASMYDRAYAYRRKPASNNNDYVEKAKSAARASNRSLSPAELQNIRTAKHKLNGKEKIDTYQYCAAIEDADSATMSQNDMAAMVINASDYAHDLHQDGREADAREIRESLAKFLNGNKSVLLSSNAIADVHGGTGDWGNGNAASAYGAAVRSHAAGLSQDAVSKLGSDQVGFIQQAFRGRDQSDADLAVFRATVESALGNEKARQTMSVASAGKLQEFLKTTATQSSAPYNDTNSVEIDHEPPVVPVQPQNDATPPVRPVAPHSPTVPVQAPPAQTDNTPPSNNSPM